MASSTLDFPRFLPAPSCRSIVVIRLGSLFKSELRTLLLNSGNPQSSLDHFLNSGLQGSPKFTRAENDEKPRRLNRVNTLGQVTTTYQNQCMRLLKYRFCDKITVHALVFASHNDKMRAPLLTACV